MPSNRAVFVRSTTERNTAKALDCLCRDLSAKERASQFVIVFFEAGHDVSLMHEDLGRTFKNAAILGGTSNGGALAAGAGPVSAALWILSDEEGDFGSACLPKGDDPAGAAEAALKKAIQSANCDGELPDLVWIYQSPGNEEAVLEGLRRIVGDRCPIVGGSAADEDLSGQWTQLATDDHSKSGIAVGAFFPSGRIEVVFQGGYEPTGKSGVVTAVSGSGSDTSGRVVREIDGVPAAEVYNGWIDGKIDAQVKSGGTVLAETTMHPLAIKTGEHLKVPQYLLIHPETAQACGSLTTFANVPKGAQLLCMKGDKSRLVARAGSVVRQACDLNTDTDAPIGAIVVYCAGCRMAIGSEDRQLTQSIESGLDGAPFVGCFTYGEQGPLANANVHGNLMISALVVW